MPTKRAPRAMLMPTLPVGAPMPVTPQPTMRITEPVTAIGDRTGTPYFKYGDNPKGPETVQVTPPGQPGPTPMATMGGPVSMAVGGTAIIGDNPQVASSMPAGGTPTTTYSGTPQIQPPAFAGSGGLLPGANNGGTGYDPLAAQHSANQAVLDARTNALGPAYASLGAQENVYNQTANTFAPRQAQIQANAAVFPVEAAQTQGQRAYIGSEQQFNTQQQQEQAGIQAAHNNTPDQIAIARAEQYRKTTDPLYGIAGVGTPVDVNTASGADQAGMPAGTRAKLMTQEDLLTYKANAADTLKKLSLASQQLGVDILGLNVDDVKRVAAQAGIPVDEANLAVDQARQQAGLASIASSRAQLGTTKAEIGADQAKLLPSDQVIYQDPITGASRLESPDQAAQDKADYQRSFELLQQPANIAQKYDLQPGELSAQAGLATGTTQLQNAQEVQYAQNPGAPGTPVNWIIANTTKTRRDVSGAVYTNPGVLTLQQGIDALVAHGYTVEQANAALGPSATTGGTGRSGGTQIQGAPQIKTGG